MKGLLSKVKAFILWPINKFKTLSWKKKVLAIILLVILLVVISSVYSNFTKKPDYETAAAEKADITEVVSETGSIASNGRADVYSPTNGIVTEVVVKNGQAVEKGAELMTIESTATEQEKQKAYSDYLAAQNTLSAAKAQLNSLQAALFQANQTFINDRGVDNPTQEQKDDPVYIQQNATWLQAEADYKNQAAVISQAQAAANQASLAYAATQNATVRSPISGNIANLAVAPGSTVRANTSVSTSPPQAVLVVSSPGTTEVVISLSETDISKANEGQKAEIEVNSIDNKTYEGIVRRVDNIGTDDQGVTRYKVYIEVTDADSKLLPGMNADVDIITKELKNVLSVPNSAVKPYQGGRGVRIIDEKTKEIKYVPVQVGVRGTTLTEILKGINEGQEVITSLSNEKLQRPGLFGS